MSRPYNTVKGMRKVAAWAEDWDESSDDTYSHVQEAGLFMLVSSREVAKSSNLSLYNTRNQVEELFRVGKGEGKMLSLDIIVRIPCGAI